MKNSRELICGVVLFVVSTHAPIANAQGLRGLIGELTRESARLADDIPVRSIDDLVEEAGRSPALREAIEKEVTKGSRAIPEAARHSEAVLTLLRETRAVDATTLKRIGELDRPAQETALAVVRGGKEVADAVPDLAARATLVKAGGPELLVAAGTQAGKASKDFILGARRLQDAIDAGQIITTTGKAVTLADYARAVVKYGDATVRFWDRYVTPHWGKWLAGGALAAYLIDPQAFQDAAGNLTEEGFRSLTLLAGEVAARAIRGGGSGSGEAAHRIWDAIVETFFSGPNSIYSIIGVLFIVAAFMSRFRRVQHWAGRPFRWLDEVPDEGKPGDRS